VARHERYARQGSVQGGNVQLTDEMLGLDNVIYVFDETLTIVEVNDAYWRFAEENGAGPEFRTKFGEGCNLLSVIPARLQPFYTKLYDRALAGGIVEHDYACHSPSRYRLFRLRLLPLDDGRVAAENSLRVDTAFPNPLGVDEAAIAARYTADNGLITECMHCRRVKARTMRERWDRVPSLIGKRDNRISHGLCMVCYGVYYPDDVASSATAVATGCLTR
jgi:hypothetical protein